MAELPTAAWTPLDSKRAPHARGRRDLVHALVPLADGRRRVRRRRLPRDRPALRRPRRGRGADPRTRSPSASAPSSTSSPTTCPTSTRGSRRRWPPGPGRPSGSGSGSATALGEHGELPPNGWESEFGGPAWSRVIGADGTPEQWYLHLFAPGQPDLNWGHPDVVREHEEILRFWFDRGVAGIRIDSAALLAKDAALPEVRPDLDPGEHPYVDREDLQGIYRVVAPDRRVLRPGPGADRRDLAARTRSGSPATCAPACCTRRSTSTSWPRRGTPPRCAARSSRPSTCTTGSAPRPPGCCPTTTSPGR